MDSTEESVRSNLPATIRYVVENGHRIGVVKNRRVCLICDSGRIDQLETTAVQNPECSWGIPIGKMYDLLVITTEGEKGRDNLERFFSPEQTRRSRHLAEIDFSSTTTIQRNDTYHLLYRWRDRFPDYIDKEVTVTKKGFIEIQPDGKTYLVKYSPPDTAPMMSLLMTGYKGIEQNVCSENMIRERIFPFMKSEDGSFSNFWNIGLSWKSEKERAITFPDPILVFSSKQHKKLL